MMLRYLNVESFSLGIRNLLLHKLRSLLTVLGIIFGVAAVICMLSVSEGASADELRAIQQLGTRNIIIQSVQPRQSSQASQANQRLQQYGIKRDDVELLRATIPHVESITVLKTLSHEIRYEDRKAQSEVTGAAPGFLNALNVGVSMGRPMTDSDMEGSKAVIILGDDVRRELFGFKDPIGQTVLVNRYDSAVPCEVIGVLERIETAGAPEKGVEERNLNREAFVPLSTEKLFGEIVVRMGGGAFELTKIEVSDVYVTVDEVDYVLPVSEMVIRVMQKNHADMDYEVKVPLAKLKIAQRKARNSQIVLGFIAGISLLVGGIGIMNIMLATVTERTREIGIRRALGARQAHIKVQFLIETVVLSTSGGGIGVLLGCVGAILISNVAGWNTIVQPWSVMVSFGLSVFVGIFFGLWPAIKAAALDPIEALRYE